MFLRRIFGGGGGVRDNVRLSLIEKLVVAFLFVLTDFFSLGVTAEELRANIEWKSAFLKK